MLYKKILLIIIAISTFNCALSQTNEKGKIIYKGKVLKFDDKKSKTLSRLNDLIDENDSIQFVLLFNRKESLFRMVRTLDADDSNLQFSKILLGEKRTYYNSKNDEPIYSLHAYGEDFLITYQTPKWSLTKENKKIGGYLCYKAITIQKVRNSKGTFNNKVTAWYTPEIPVSVGPKGYFGLPGLILQLQEKNKLFVASTINLNNNHVKIEKPTKGKRLTQEEFENIGIKMDEERFSKSK